MDKELIGNNLKFLRKSTKLTVLDFADKMITSDSSIRYHERGCVSVEVLLRYKKEFNVSLDDICFKNLAKFGI